MRLSCHYVAMSVVAILANVVYSAGPAVGNRKPQWPLKTARVLLTDEQIAHARKLCDSDPDAKAIRKKTIDEAAYWVGKTEVQLREMLPDGAVPRAFNVSATGCPVHGKAIYKHGTYPWKLDRDRPFTVICPVGGERYPSNDFDAYYRSGMADKSLLTGDYADDGRGWAGPSGEKYWLVGYACHWNWSNNWVPAVKGLAHAYVLTGNRDYARKAIAMLDRVAEIYPGMKYSEQSRYAELVGGTYKGKILNLIWETGVLRDLAKSYDRVFDALIGEDAISLPWRSAPDIRANIEANLLEEGLDAVDRHQIRGNFGMHQSALAYTVAVRQNGPTKKLLDGILNKSGGSYINEGINYALYNLVFKDGMPYETSPGYCFGWVSHFVEIADAMSGSGVDLYKHPKLRWMFDAPLDMICAGRFTPVIGDTGSITAGWSGPSAFAYEAAYRNLRDLRYAWALDQLGALKGKKIAGFDDLFHSSMYGDAKSDASKYRHQPSSRLMDGYGLSVLNNKKDSLAVSMYYGIKGGHGHYDALNIELFGQDRRLSPDLGYPDFMNAFVSGIYTWSKNTVSHNCLVVDKTIQRDSLGGKVLRFHDAPTVHVADVDVPSTYSQVATYRRTLVLVDVDEDNSYLVDVLRVRGGKDHVLSIHGGEGEFKLAGTDLSPAVTEGTLAGKDVALGEIYDNAVLGKPGYKGGFSGYRGSGYQHFFNWQKTTADKALTGIWRLKGESASQLRVHVAPAAGQELIVADAFVSPTQKIPTVLKYMLVRRIGDESGNTFATVWEPTGGEAIIDRIEFDDNASLGTGCDRTIVMKVHRKGVTDTIAVAPQRGTPYSIGHVKSDAAVRVGTEKGGQPVRIFTSGGSNQVVHGRVDSADYGNKSIAVKVASPLTDVDSLVGRKVRIFNDRHSCMYSIKSASVADDMLTLKLTGSDVFIGRIKLKAVDQKAGTVTTDTQVLYPYNMAGGHLVTQDLDHAASVVSMAGGVIKLADGANLDPFAAIASSQKNTDAWISDFGAGDQIEIERFIYEETP